MMEDKLHAKLDAIWAARPDIQKYADNGQIRGYNVGWSELYADLGVQIIACEAIGDYQGDEIYLLKLGQFWGFNVIGYGSCEGCDWLMSIDTAKDLDDARRSILYQANWFLSPQDGIKFLSNRDNANSWYLNEEESKGIIESFIKKLQMHVPVTTSSKRDLRQNPLRQNRKLL